MISSVYKTEIINHWMIIILETHRTPSGCVLFGYLQSLFRRTSVECLSDIFYFCQFVLWKIASLSQCEIFHPSGLTQREKFSSGCEKILKDFQFAQIPQISYFCCCWAREDAERNPCKTKPSKSLLIDAACHKKSEYKRFFCPHTVIGKDSGAFTRISRKNNNLNLAYEIWK